MASAFDNQISNRNFLSPIGFKFTLAKEPKVAFFSNSARIPEITLGTATQPSYLKMIDVPGEIIEYGDFNLRFLVDENLENYMAFHNWITGLGFPETPKQFKDFVTDDSGGQDRNLQFSDGSLRILNSNYNSTAVVKFKDMFPVSLSALEFEATENDYNYFTADVSFKYTVYNILSNDGEPL
jgi:hypothetical protein